MAVNNNHWLVDRIRADKDGNGPGILLNADEVWRSKTGEETNRAVFKLHSDRFQKEFVTLWELFDERNEFDRCISELAELAKDVRKKTPFASIVTCTPTARYITDHLHSRIEGEKEKVDVQFLWHHPFFTLDGKPLSQFDNGGVLIVTDVAATGSLAGQMAETVERLGGNPVAVLAVMIVDRQLANDPRIAYRSAKESVKQADGAPEQTEYLPVVALAHYPIESIPPEDSGKSFDKEKILSIDSRTVLPKDPEPAPLFDFKARFDQYTMLRQLDHANALQFGFFSADDSKFTIAVNFDRVLNPNSQNGNSSASSLPDLLWQEAWKAIADCFQSPAFGAQPVIVTTFDAEDLRFKDFVERRLSDQGKQFEKAYISKHDAHEWASGYFVLPQHARKLANRRVILILASVHSSEKLRNLASLLASYSASSINVVCLLNRMGTATRNFMLRIENLLRGLGTAPDGKADFNFTYLYSLIDIDSDEIENAQAMVDSLLSGYKKATRVASFRRLVEQDRSYFGFRTTTSREFHTYTSPKLRRAFSVTAEPKPSLFVETQAAEAAMLVGYLIQTRNFAPLIEEISQIAAMPVENLLEKRSLFHTYAVLLCYLGYLRVGSTLRDLREALTAAITALRNRRLHPESADDFNATELLLSRETDLLFGLALFSYLAPDGEVERLVDEALFCNRTAAEWLADPKGLLLHFGEERITYVASLTLHLSNPRFRQADVAAHLKKRLIDKIAILLRSFQTVLTDEQIRDVARGKELRSRTMNNLNFLLKEIEEQRLLGKHEVVRRLHRDLLYTKIDHSPMVTGLRSIDTNIADYLLDAHANKELPNNLVSFAGRSVQEAELSAALEDAVYSIGVLEDIVNSIRQLFLFTRCDWSRAQYFASDRNEPGLAQVLWALGDLLQDIRMEKQVSWAHYENVLNNRNKIIKDIWARESYLRSLLVEYVAPLRSTLLTALKLAADDLRDKYGELWAAEIERQQESLKNIGEAYVLFWLPALLEILRNLFKNVRHSLIKTKERHDFADQVVLIVEPARNNYSDGGGPAERFWRVQVDSFGKVFGGLPGSCTFLDQKEEVAEMGGTLDIDGVVQGDRNGARATLMVYARKPIPKLEKQPGGDD